jgi:hypothetical protein
MSVLVSELPAQACVRILALPGCIITKEKPEKHFAFRSLIRTFAAATTKDYERTYEYTEQDPRDTWAKGDAGLRPGRLVWCGGKASERTGEAQY